MTRRRWWLVALAAIALVLLAGRALAALYVDYQWYDSLGAAPLWRAKTAYVAVLKTFSGLLAGAFVFANLYAVRHSVVSLRFPRRLANLEIAEEVPGRYLVVAALAISVVLGALFTVPSDDWTTFALTQLGIPFGEGVGYFEADLGFFVYWLPFETALFIWSLLAVLMVSAVVVFLYALTPSLRWERGSLYVSNYVRRHFAVLVTGLMIIVAWWFRLDAYSYLIDNGSGPDGAFTYVDYHASVQSNLVLSAGIIGAAVTVLITAWQGHVRMAFATLFAAATLSVAVRRLAPVITDRFTPPAERASRDKSFLATRGEYSRRAYGVDRITKSDSVPTFSSLAEAARGVPVWDPAALTRPAAQQRRNAPSSWVGWSASSGGVTAVVPERPTAGTEARAPWPVALMLGTAVDARGEPVRVTEGGNPALEDPLVAPVLVHDSASAFLVVSDSQNRVAAPSMVPAIARLATAWSLQNFRLYFGETPSPNAKLAFRRDVRERIHALAPFFDQSSSEFPVVVADTLWWVVDLYAASTRYPLSHHVLLPHGEVSYFQHAAVAMVNATTGQVMIVADAQLDPLARSWVRAFPGSFTTWTRVPAALANALPPALDLLHAQADILARYGLVGETVPNGRAAWDDGSEKPLAQGDPPLFTVGAAGQQRLAATEVTLDSASRVVGALIGTGDVQRSIRWLPLPRPGPSWGGVAEQLHHASDSTVVSAREASLVRGRIRVVPVDRSLVFVQPTYFWSSDGAAALAHVTALDGDKIRSGVTLAEAVGLAAPSVADSLAPPTSPAAFRARVQAYYEQMRAALRRGDWPAFGRAYDALGALLAMPAPSPGRATAATRAPLPHAP